MHSCNGRAIHSDIPIPTRPRNSSIRTVEANIETIDRNFEKHFISFNIDTSS